MIIEGLLNVVYALFSLLTAAINIPAMPEEIQEVILQVIDYITTGIALLANWTHLGYLLVLFGVVMTRITAVFQVVSLTVYGKRLCKRSMQDCLIKLSRSLTA
jgi:hypothetical protein